MAEQKHVFIINPMAGKKDRTDVVSAAIGRLTDTDKYIEITSFPGDATEIVKRYRRDHEGHLRFYACGGDGTLNEVVSGVYGLDDAAVGAVPIGSGNDFVKYFEDIPEKKFRNLEEMVCGSEHSCDLLKIEDENGLEKISINIVSAGFDSAVAAGMTKYKALPFIKGKGAYNLSLMACLITKMKHYISLEADGVKIDEGPYLFALCANGRFYGGGYKGSPISQIDDGKMDFIRIDTVSRLKFLKLVGIYKRGEHLEKLQEILRYQESEAVKFSADKDIDFNIDGEIVKMKNPTVKVIKSAIKIIIPS